MRSTTEVSRGKKLRERKTKLIAFSFTLPNTILYVLFFILPFSLGLYYSFTEYNGIQDPVFIGLDNYVELFQDDLFWEVLLNTAQFAIIKIPVVVFLALATALLLNSKILKGRSFHRAVIYFPTLLSSVMIGVTWRWIFGQEYGLINQILTQFGFDPIEWASNGTAAFATVIIASGWVIGANMLLFLGGLSTISDTYYEAAEIDGATSFQQLRQITIPLLRPTMYMVFTLTMVAAFKEYAMTVTLTGGGPGNDTTFMVQYIYETGFELLKVGYASAASMVLFAILLVISIIRETINRGGRIDG